MVEVGRPTVDLAPLAPNRIQGEAISSWLARTSAAHHLMLSELEDELGSSVAAFDRGNCSQLARLAAMTGAAVGELQAVISPDLVAHPLRTGPGPPSCWAVCPKCLTDDEGQGRPPHVRAAWVHPLATACSVHRRHLVPYAASPIRIVEDEILFADSGETLGRQDLLLEKAAFDDWRMLDRVNRALQRSSRPAAAVELLELRFAVRDVVDGLATQARPPMGALMNVFEWPLFARRSIGGSLRLPADWWSDLDATDRLLFVRIALAILSEPPDPAKEQP